MHPGREAKLLYRTYEKLLQLGGPFLIAPVPYPDHIAEMSLGGSRAEEAHVGGFMPRPDPLGPALLEIAAPDHFAKREHSVIVLQLVSRHLLAIGDRAMMCVVKEEMVPARCCSMAADCLHQARLVPLMDQYQVCSVEFAVEIETGKVV